MFRKIIAWTLLIALTATAAVGGTLAYLTDRDSEANVFTVGDVKIDLTEDFNREDATLMPGKDITKEPSITNEGSNPAWVWATIAIPAALDNDDASKNVVHFNYSKESVDDGFWNWQGDGDWMVETVEHDGIDYNVYTVLYETALQPGETTEYPVMTKVYMDPHVDITPEGDVYHVEAGVAEKLDWNINEYGEPIIYVSAYAMQTNEFGSALAAYEAYQTQWGDNGMEWGSVTDEWDGTADTTWYNDTDTEFELTTAEQLAGLAELVDGGNTFEGKTVKLGTDLDLDNLLFEPIGSYRKDTPFMGTFDGQDHTISNLSQNTWALDNGYYYGDLGMGLFGKVEDATIKDLTMDNASISGESAICGTVAACAYGDMTFENITVKNSEVADYQYYAGGIVGWASGDHQYINCNVDASTTIGGQWGDFNNANGGVIGGAGTSAAILMKDCTVACRIDGFNDVTSAYEWYSYRSSGMLIGNSGQKDDPDGDNVGNAIAPNLTCENVTVIYGDWANYHYCQFKAMGYPWVRVEAGTSTGAYSNPRYGHPTDANGNEVVDDNHVHNDGEKHNELIVFDQLYGGTSGHRYCTYGTATHEGVTVVYNNK